MAQGSLNELHRLAGALFRDPQHSNSTQELRFPEDLCRDAALPKEGGTEIRARKFHLVRRAIPPVGMPWAPVQWLFLLSSDS